MALYFTSNTYATTPAQQVLSSSAKTLTAVYSKAAASGITLSRAFIYEFEVGTSSTPHATDCAVIWSMVAETTTGTSTVGLVQALDPADTAASHDSFINHTANGTSATPPVQRWELAANQRASYRWVVNPGGPGELVVIATASNGLAIRALSSTYTGSADAAVYFRE